MKKIIIAIDGHSSCGKSTLAKALSSELKYRYIDTGAMYRAVALYFMRENLLSEPINESEIIMRLPKIKIDFKYEANSDQTLTYLNGENVEEEIRGVAVSNEVSKVSQISEVRRVLVNQQKEMGQSKAVVMDGRDIGTRVFPEAELKLFVTADVEVRTDRRYSQMKAKGISVSREEVRSNLNQRDFDDEHKGESPLKKAVDAIIIDNTHLTIQEGVDLALRLALKEIKR
ncbi:MAG: (d)CMP kinase [Vicingaceae bacterium]